MERRLRVSSVRNFPGGKPREDGRIDYVRGFTGAVLCTEAYGNQCRAMEGALGRHFPKSIGFTKPQGGMFYGIH